MIARDEMPASRRHSISAGYTLDLHPNHEPWTCHQRTPSRGCFRSLENETFNDDLQRLNVLFGNRLTVRVQFNRSATQRSIDLSIGFSSTVNGKQARSYKSAENVCSSLSGPLFPTKTSKDCPGDVTSPRANGDRLQPKYSIPRKGLGVETRSGWPWRPPVFAPPTSTCFESNRTRWPKVSMARTIKSTAPGYHGGSGVDGGTSRRTSCVWQWWSKTFPFVSLPRNSGLRNPIQKRRIASRTHGLSNNHIVPA